MPFNKSATVHKSRWWLRKAILGSASRSLLIFCLGSFRCDGRMTSVRSMTRLIA